MTLKFVAISGSIDKKSYNTKLLMFMANHFRQIADIEILDISQVPIFNESEDLSESDFLQYLNAKIAGSDGVILATPEHDHTTTPAMKSILEWMSYKLHPFVGKPVLLVGASWTNQGSSRAQLDLKQVLESPGVNAVVMPGDEFLLGNSIENLPDEGGLRDPKTVEFLTTVFTKFVSWVKVMQAMKGEGSGAGAGTGVGASPATADSFESEDLAASQPIDTTIEGVDMKADDWVEQAAEKTQAAHGSDYVMLDRGVLSVDQLNWFLNTMPMELTYADDNNQFLYYNHTAPGSQMLAPRDPSQAGDAMVDVHPSRAIPGVKRVIHALRRGTDLVLMAVPGNKVNQKYIMHCYKAMRDSDGRYRGVNEWVLDVWPIVADYLKRTGQMLVTADGRIVSPENAGAASVPGGVGAGNSAADADAGSSASKHGSDAASSPAGSASIPAASGSASGSASADAGSSASKH